MQPKHSDGAETSAPRQDGPPGNSWFKCWRNNPDASELWKKHRPAFFILWLIAHRARYSEGFNAHGLERGQAFIGKMDAEFHGISEQEYRTAKRILQDGRFATFKPTNQGTIATLINTGIFDPFTVQGNEPANEQATSGQRAGNERVTPNKKESRKEGEESKTLDNGKGTKHVIVSLDELLKEFPNLDTAEFRKAWQDWLDFRKEIKRPLNTTSIRALLKMLSACGPNNAIESITNSIANGYQGLFPETEKRPRPNPLTSIPPTPSKSGVSIL